MGQKSQGNKQKKIKRNKSCYQMLTKPEKQELLSDANKTRETRDKQASQVYHSRNIKATCNCHILSLFAVNSRVSVGL